MEKVNLKEKVLMVIDSGQFISFAQCLSPNFKKTYYSKPWNINGFPHINDRCIGMGYEGIEVIDDPYKKIDEVDLFVFTDLYNGEFQKHLIKLGKNVFGSRGNETLELDRWEFRKLLIKLGIPRAKCELKKGFDNLNSYLKNVENKYVKISKYRKIHETFHHINYNLSKSILNDISHQTGSLRNQIDFIVEDEIKSIIEVGYDGFVIDGKYPQNAFFGIELKDMCYLGKTMSYEDLPKPIKDVNKKMAPYFKDYRMCYSNEMRFVNKNTGFLTDPTCRLPSPPSEIYQELISNLSEMCWVGSQGELIEPKYNAKYAGEVIITSSLLEHGIEQPIEYPKSIEKNVKLRYSCKIDGGYVCISQNMPEVGAVVAIGNSIEEVTEKLKDICSKIKGNDLCMRIDKIDNAVDELEKLEEIGIKF
jgi:hypothetical protein